MPARVSFTAIACASVTDATRLAASFLTAWPGPGPKPDLIEANGGEVDLTWQTQSSAAPAAAIAAGQLAAGVKVKSFSHTDGKNQSSGSGN